MTRALIIRSDDLRAENRYRILRTIRQAGSISRARVGKLTGLSQASLSNLIGSMVEQEILRSSGRTVEVARRGRPQTTVELCAGAAYGVTVALTVNSLVVCVVDYQGETVCREEHRIETQAFSSSSFTDYLISALTKVATSIPADRLLAIAVGFQGLTDSQAGDLLWSPIFSFDYLNLTALLQKHFNVSVSVNNDCALIAQALHYSQAEKLGDSFAAVSFAHGVGMGVYLAGQPLSGARSSAMEFGHIQYKCQGALCRCGRRGCIEAYAADYGIARMVNGLSDDTVPDSGIDLQACTLAAKNRNINAVNAFSEAGKAIGTGLTAIFNLLDPIPVALVGRNFETVELLHEKILSTFASTGRYSINFESLIHIYDNEVPLLHAGLVLEVSRIMDRHCADKHSHSKQAEPV